MMNKILWMLVLVLWLGFVTDYLLFRYAGKRFTASDGDKLCLRVQALDGLPCQYMEPIK